MSPSPVTDVGDPGPASWPRRWLVRLGAVAFLAATVFFASSQLGGQWSEVATAMTGLAVWRLALATVLIGVATAIAGLAWLTTLRRFGHRVGVLDALAIVFVGQLGRYLPGSLWSVGIHAQLARRSGVPVRVSVATSLLFVGWHLATAVAVGSFTVLVGAVSQPLPGWLVAAALLASLGCTVPPVVNRLGTLLGGSNDRLQGRWNDWVALWMLFAIVWSMYGAALTLLVSPHSNLPVGVAIGAFAVAYAMGLLVIVAPAGLGAREVALVALMGPSVGTSSATAAVLLSRVVFVTSDFAVAAITWTMSRRGDGRPVVHDE